MEDFQTMNDVQHADFIWTWKSNARGSKASIWVPYLGSIEKRPRSKNWLLTYNGGKLELDLENIDFIMFYGACGSLPLDFIDAVSQHKIVLMIHRRNQIHPMVFFPAYGQIDSFLETSGYFRMTYR